MPILITNRKMQEIEFNICLAQDIRERVGLRYLVYYPKMISLMMSIGIWGLKHSQTKKSGCISD